MAAVIFIVRTLLGLLAMVFLLRVLLPLCRAESRNPLSQGIIHFTNPLVLPLRRVLPPLQRLDTASLAALLLVQLGSTALIWVLSGMGAALVSSPGLFLYASLHELLALVLQFYFVVLLLYAVLSWVAHDTYSPASSVISSLSVPVVRPFQRLIPPIAGMDLSVLFALIAVQALRILLDS
jgi:YggT family protein